MGGTDMTHWFARKHSEGRPVGVTERDGFDMRHGRRIVWVLAWLITGNVAAEPIAQIGSATFDVEYLVDDAAMPLDVVTLWYTIDEGASWVEHGRDVDRESPMSFHARRDGRHGFYFVIQNSTGTSSPPPFAGTRPQLSVFVDNTLPVAELYPLRQLEVVGKRTLQIRWTARDINFAERPVQLRYRRLPDAPWAAIGDAPLPNTGWYDWQIPDALSGPVAVRLTVVDRAGRETTVGPQTLEIKPPSANEPSNDQMFKVQRPLTPSGAPPSTISTTQDHAERLMAQAAAYRERGQYPEAISRLREAVRLKPRWADAFVEMGEMLYHVGDVAHALNAYEIALKQQPLSRRALRGAAVAHRRRNDHESAGRLLRTILSANPNDAEVWINLGDIAVFQGDEVLARECYTRASLVDPEATQIVGNARRRLELMSTVSRTYATGR